MSSIYAEISDLSSSLLFAFLIIVRESPSTSNLLKPRSKHNFMATVQPTASAAKGDEILS
ncbi:hypothetical protein ES319_A10G196700v1 [Gossypium barbadense]|uniref:Uncharacterized protein n=1 Tax=Gossypium barbadense TaxID=3634 RepID=A0A5J5U979_GOSBA|nr:hypothetical protein ES319_A10G196700v1 [Gossypium barbadense]